MHTHKVEYWQSLSGLSDTSFVQRTKWKPYRKIWDLSHIHWTSQAPQVCMLVPSHRVDKRGWKWRNATPHHILLAILLCNLVLPHTWPLAQFVARSVDLAMSKVQQIEKSSWWGVQVGKYWYGVSRCYRQQRKSAQKYSECNATL